MSEQEILILIPYILSLAVITGVGAYTLNRRTVPGARAYAIAVLFQALWTVGFIVEMLNRTLNAKLLWDSLQWVPALFGPVATLFFALEYAGIRPQRPWRFVALLSIVPLIFLLLLATNPLHGLVVGSTWLSATSPFPELQYDFTLPAYLVAVYIYALYIAEFYILIRRLLRVQSLYRVQIGLVLAGMLVPMIGGLLMIAGVHLSDFRDTTPLSFALGDLLVLWGLFRYQFLDVVPVARDKIVECMRDMVIVLDVQGRVIDVNPAVQRVLDVPMTSIIGQPVPEVFKRWSGVVDQFRGVNQINTEIEIDMDGGQRSILEVALSPLTSPQGRLQGRVVVLRDITHHKEAEESLRRQAEELEQARRQAEQADEIKSRFLANMSHELRSPLNGILSLTEMVALELFGPLNDRQKEYLQKSLHSGEHLLALINDILDINKIQAGMLSLYFEDNVNIYELLDDVLAAAEGQLHDKPVRVIKDYDLSLPPLCCDRRRLRQVIYNLLSNAIKFTDSGTITVSVKQQSKDEILLVVSDTGPGINAEDQATIFKPFVQAAAGQMHSGGTGLGLPISQHIVEAHGGRMWVKSDPGDGAAFYVVWPVRRERTAPNV